MHAASAQALQSARRHLVSGLSRCWDPPLQPTSWVGVKCAACSYLITKERAPFTKLIIHYFHGN